MAQIVHHSVPQSSDNFVTPAGRAASGMGHALLGYRIALTPHDHTRTGPPKGVEKMMPTARERAPIARLGRFSSTIVSIARRCANSPAFLRQSRTYKVRQKHGTFASE